MKWQKQKVEKLLFSIGMGLMLAFTGLAIAMTAYFFQLDGVHPHVLFNAGIDVFGVAVCAVMYYGCLGDEESEREEPTQSFIMLILLCGVCFIRNLCIWYVDCIQSYRAWYVVVTAIGNSVDVLLVYSFYRYICSTLEVDAALTRWSRRVSQIGLFPTVLLIMASCFAPVTFWVDEHGALRSGALFWVGDVYVMCSILLFAATIFRSSSPRRQKLVASTFVVIPAIVYLIAIKLTGRATLYAVQYASVLVTLVLIRNVLFAEWSKKMAASRAEIQMAASIQANILPNTFPAYPNRKEFDIFATMDPAKEVGGDFYDFFMVGEDHLTMVVADVSGKGVPAALFSMIAKTMLKTQSQTVLNPERILSEVNAALGENNEEGMFVTVWLGILELSTGELTYADARHEKLALYQNGEWKLLPKACGVPLAAWPPDVLELMDESYRFHNRVVQLKPGDMIFQYTDGITEATDANEELFGEERLMEALNASPSAQPEELLPRVREKINGFVKDAPQFDDITMLALRYNGENQTG